MRTDAYQFTVDLVEGQPVQWEALRQLRARVRAYNKALGGTLYVKMQGRLGEGNPNAAKYGRGRRYHNHQCIRLNDALKADVYIYERNR